MVKWSLRDSTGCKQRGEIELAQIPGELLRFEREAARIMKRTGADHVLYGICLLYTSPSPRDRTRSRMPSSA